MAFRIPTTQEIVDRNIAKFESKLNQTIPDADKAFIKVLAILEAMAGTGLYRFAAERAKQNLALTANESGLTIFGDEYGVTRKPARACQLDIETTADPATSIGPTDFLTGDPNSEKYFPNATYTESGGKIEATVTAENPGISGNLNPGDTLILDDPITGVGNVWTVMEVAVLGLDQEDLEDWRRRILLEIQTVGGGGNGVDYRTWAEETPGCFRAFPYSGAPVTTVSGFVDGDMEDPGISAWSTYGSATLTKQTTSPESGERYLRIAYNGYSNPAAFQDPPLNVGTFYRITGYARGDGTYAPMVVNGAEGLLWTGTSSTNWQSFDVIFEATSTDIYLSSLVTGSGYVEYDTIDIVQVSYPGDRTVYVEADSDIDPDGIAPSWLLDDVRDYINTDPTTAKNRPPLGETDENLYVLSIYRTTFDVEIRDLMVDSDIEAETKSRILTAVENYLLRIAPFIEGVDPPASKNDVITDLTLSQIIQNTLDRAGATAGGIGISVVPDVFISSYTLGQGELAKLGTITYV